MNPTVARTIEHLHGHLAWLATAALYHPAIVLRRPKRRAVGAALGAAALVTVTAALGAAIYPAYRVHLKPAIFAGAPIVGMLFERKEHLGIGAVVLAWAGAVLHLRARDDAWGDRPGARAAFVAFVGAALFATLAASMGVVVAVYRTFS
jgi:hypothetical protein